VSSAKRGRHAKRPTRANRASGLAVAVGLGVAVATGHGVASAATDDGNSSDPSATDTGSKAGAAGGNPSGTTASATSGVTTATEPEPTTTTTTSSGSQTTTTTTSGEGPTSSVTASGGSGTTVSGEGSSATSTNSSATTPTQTAAEPTTEKPAPPEQSQTDSGTTTPATETTSATENKEKSSSTPTEQTGAPAAEVKQIETAETHSVAAVTTEPKIATTSAAPAAKMMAASSATTQTTPGLPTVTLPPYPTIPGVSATKVAVAVVLVLGKALQAALSGPIPNPIAIPIYMLLVAAYQRLTEIALNHVPVAGTPSTPLQLLGTVTGNIGTATDQDGDPLTYTVTTQPTKGTVALVGTTYTYIPSVPTLRDGGTDSFTVTIDDLQGAADHPYAPNGHATTETINLNIAGTGINVPPIVTATQGARDGIGVVRGGFTVVDLDDNTRTFSLANGNTAGATATSAFTNLGGIVSINQATGDWTYVPAVSGNLLGIPTHTDSFVVTVDDGHSGGAVQTTVSIGADLGVAVTGMTTNSTSGVVTGGLNIPAGDNGLLTYAVGTGPSTKGSVFVTTTGGFIYTPTDAARHAAAADNATAADKTDTFTIKGTDANGRSITVATVQVTISATNAAPGGTATFNAANSSGVITGSVSVTDADDATLSYSGQASKGTVSFTGSTFTYTPTLTARHAAAADGASTATKEDTITITVNDLHGGVKTFTQTISITPQNTVPTYTNVTKASSGLLNLTKTWTVNGMADVDGDTLKLAVTSLPSGGLLNVPLVLGNTVTLVSLLTESGKTFVVTMSDGYGGNVPITLTI
jgi:hypothetical protein